MNDYSSLLYSEKSVLATDCYDLTPLTYEERGMLYAKTQLQFQKKKHYTRRKKKVTGYSKKEWNTGQKFGKLRHQN